MKGILSGKKTMIILLIVTIIWLGFYAYMLVRPISYGLNYHNETAYGSEVFKGTMKFHFDRTMVNKNTNFNEELQSRYYYKDGYIFYTMAQTDEEYAQEVAYIKENFGEAIVLPFYADKINAFRLVVTEAESDTVVYTCTAAIIFAVVGGIIELVLLGFICGACIVRKKSNF